MIDEDSLSNSTESPSYSYDSQSPSRETQTALNFDSSPESGGRSDGDSRSRKRKGTTGAVVVNGTHIQLPGDKYNPAYFVKILEEREQAMYDYIGNGRYTSKEVLPVLDPERDYDKYPMKGVVNGRYGNIFSSDEVLSWDNVFFKFEKKLPRMHIDFRQLGIFHSVYEALEDSGITMRDIYRSRAGVFVGARSPYTPTQTYQFAMMNESKMRNQNFMLADHISYFFGMTGPSVTLDTACSSAGNGIVIALKALENNDIDYAICVGAHVGDMEFIETCQQSKIVNLSGKCKPFDDTGPYGFLNAECFGTVILSRKEISDTKRHDIKCSVLGGAFGAFGPTSDASDGNQGRMIELPCSLGMKKLYDEVYAEKNIVLEDVDYIEMHATGTKAGDVIELESVGEYFADSHNDKSNPLRIASVKGNVGHCLIAAGIVSAIKCIQMMVNRQFYPTAGVEVPRKDFDWKKHNIIPQQTVEDFPEDKQVIIGCSSFGVGGSIAHYVFAECDERLPRSTMKMVKENLEFVSSSTVRTQTDLILPLSSVSEKHLSKLAAVVLQYLEDGENVNVNLINLCATYAVHRSIHSHRQYFIGSTRNEMAHALRSFLGLDIGDELNIDEITNSTTVGKCVNTSIKGGNSMKYLFVFTGQGAQWAGMGETLMQYQAYYEVVRKVDKEFEALSGWSILEKCSKMDKIELGNTQYCQPYTFLLQMGLFELLKQVGISPTLITGHSAGEVVAAYASGLLTLEEATKVVYYRSQLQQEMAGCGRLLAIGCSETFIENFLKEHSFNTPKRSTTATEKENKEPVESEENDLVEIACVNSGSSVVLASSEEILTKVKDLLPDGVFSAFVPGNIAFHSSRVEPILKRMKKALNFLDTSLFLERGQYSIPFISTVTGDIETCLNENYWCANVRYAVLFEKAIKFAFSNPKIMSHGLTPNCVIEIGPHKTLAGPCSQIIATTPSSTTPVFPILKRGTSCSNMFLSFLGKLYNEEVPINFAGLYDSLGYQFDRNAPKTPYIRKQLFCGQDTGGTWFKLHEGSFGAGPIVGILDSYESTRLVKHQIENGANYHNLQFATPISDEHCRDLLGYEVYNKKDGLSPAFYLEQILEGINFANQRKNQVWIPMTLQDVSFNLDQSLKELPIFPLVNVGRLQLDNDDGKFIILSSNGSITMEEENLSFTLGKEQVMTVEHCAKGSFSVSPTNFQDNRENIGVDGLAVLQNRHSTIICPNKESIYNQLLLKDIFGVTSKSKFRCGISFSQDLLANSFLGKFSLGTKKSFQAWNLRGGIFPVESLDFLYQCAYLFPQNIERGRYVPGGFKELQLYGKPQVNPNTGDDEEIFLYAVFTLEEENEEEDSSKATSTSTPMNIDVYDSMGNKIIAAKKVWCYLVDVEPNVALAKWVWQPITDVSKKEKENLLPPHNIESKSVFDTNNRAEVESATMIYNHDNNTMSQITALILKFCKHNLTSEGQNFFTFKILECIDISANDDMTMEINDEEIIQYLDSWHNIAQLQNVLLQQIMQDGNSSLNEGKFVIEYFIASHRPAILQKLQEKIQTCFTENHPLLPSWLRLRFVPLENGDLPSPYFDEMMFDAIFINNWAKSERIWTSIGSKLKLNIKAVTKANEDIVDANTIDDSFMSAKNAVLYKLFSYIKDEGQLLISEIVDTKQKEDTLHEWAMVETLFGAVPTFYSTNNDKVYCTTSEKDIKTTSLNLQCTKRVTQALANKKLTPAELNTVTLPKTKLLYLAIAETQMDIEALRIALQSKFDVGHDTKSKSNSNIVEVVVQGITFGNRKDQLNEQSSQIEWDTMVKTSLKELQKVQTIALENQDNCYFRGCIYLAASMIKSSVCPVGGDLVNRFMKFTGTFRKAGKNELLQLMQGSSSITRSNNNDNSASLFYLKEPSSGYCNNLNDFIHDSYVSAPSLWLVTKGVHVNTPYSMEKKERSNFETMINNSSQASIEGMFKSLTYRGTNTLDNFKNFKKKGFGDLLLLPKYADIEDFNDVLNQNALAKLILSNPREREFSVMHRKEKLFENAQDHIAEVDAFVLRYIPFEGQLISDYKGGAAFEGELKNQGRKESPGGRHKESSSLYHKDGIYLVTGASGGMGVAIVRDLYKKGARHFVLTVTRSPERIPSLFADLLADIEVSLTVQVVDTGKESDIANLFEFLEKEECPKQKCALVGIFHLAGFARDYSNIDDLTMDEYFIGAQPKSAGAFYLHKYSVLKESPLQVFFILGSAASIVCAPNLPVYNAANCALNAITRTRQLMGLPCHALAMSSVYNTGLVKNDSRIMVSQIESNVMHMFTFEKALQYIEDTITLNQTPVSCSIRYMYNSSSYSSGPNFSHGSQGTVFLPDLLNRNSEGSNMNISSPEDVLTILIKVVKEIGELSSTNAGSRLSDAGIDSFTSLLLGSQVQKLFGVKFPEILLSNSVQTFALQIYDKMFDGSDSEESEESYEEIEVKQQGKEVEPEQPVNEEEEMEEQQQLTEYFIRKAAATHKEQARNHVFKMKEDFFPNHNSSIMVENGVKLSLNQKALSSVSAASILHSQSSFANHFVEDTEVINDDMVSDENLLEPTMETIGCLGKVKIFGGGNGAKVSIDSDMTKEIARKWCHVSHPKSNPLNRLICFTWAGGTTAVFKEQCWEQDPNTEIVRIVMPGREMRREEGSQNFDIKIIARFVVKAMEALEYFQSRRSSSPSQTKETDDIYVKRFPKLYVLGTSYGAYVGLEVLRLLRNSHNATNLGGFFPITVEPPNIRRRNGLTVRWTLGLLWRINETLNITGRRKLVRVDYKAWNTKLARKNLFDDIEYMDKYYIPTQINITKPNSEQYQIDRVLGDIPFHVIKAEHDDISNESNMNFWAEYTRGESQFHTIKDGLHLVFLNPSTNEAVANLVFSVLSNKNE